MWQVHAPVSVLSTYSEFVRAAKEQEKRSQLGHAYQIAKSNK
jgi:hypothetical protein